MGRGGRRGGRGGTLPRHLVTPVSMWQVLTKSLSTSTEIFSFSAFCDALAIAERSTFSIGFAARLLVNAGTARASFTLRRRIVSMPSRAFWAELFIYFPIA